ncbi:MAG: oligopeptidase B [Candidatus Azotimanducaceae bacterium]|jgi:oligopeptidase B
MHRPFSTFSIFTFVGLLLSACWSSHEDKTVLSPPVAKILPHKLTIHGDERVDNYFWIRDDDRRDPEVLALLKEENEYTKSMLAHTQSLQATLFDEITHRLTSDDRTVPVTLGNYDYHREYRLGGEYPIYLRRKLDEQEAEILLDVNLLAMGHDYFQVGNWAVNPSANKLAFASDDVSRRIYQIRFKDLDSGALLPDIIENASSSLAWSNDNKTLFYVEKDLQTLLPKRVKRHVLGQPVSEDVIVYEESDQAFSTSLYTTRSGAYIVIRLSATDSTEIRLIDANHPESEMMTFLDREVGHEFQIRHIKNQFYILTNWQAENFRLMSVDDQHLQDKKYWQELIPHKTDVLLQDVEVFENFLVIEERKNGLPNLRVINRDTFEENLIKFPDETYHARLHSNPEINSKKLRYVYSSLTTPETVFEYHMTKKTSVLLKQDKVLGEFDIDLYHSERLMVEVRDGTMVPVSLVYRKDKKREGENPLYLYAYGSYGYSTEPTFNSKRLSLLDRGFVYAMIHVRGGKDLGGHWYEEGKLLNKRNTFSDFIDAGRALIERGYGDKEKVFAMGASAGGLLMGVIANEAPEDYLAIIAHVPFVDVITTMLDESIPLTTGEFKEWGNPKEKASYDYMLSYSPYDQVKAQHYPNLYVTTGLHDSQVQYFEPVKWVSKLRQFKLDDNRLLLDIDMDTGHGGASGRYDAYQSDAREYAFILDLLEGS